MKLVRFGEVGHERPGLLDEAGQIRDLSEEIPDIHSAYLSSAKLAQLQAINLNALPIIKSSPRIGACVGGVGKFIGIGLNYKDHAKEVGFEAPSEPILFLKATSSIIGAYDDIIIPRNAKQTDWETELGVVIADKAKYVSEQEAMNYVAGFCLVNDVSEREFQLKRGGQWDKGKGCDTFGPIGPWLVTKDEIADPQNLSVQFSLNGKRYQDGNTKDMIFNVAYLISYLSQFFTLHPGDVITTGSPAGVGFSQEPSPIFLNAGDEITLSITGLGEQTHRIIAE